MRSLRGNEITTMYNPNNVKAGIALDHVPATEWRGFDWEEGQYPGVSRALLFNAKAKRVDALVQRDADTHQLEWHADSRHGTDLLLELMHDFAGMLADPAFNMLPDAVRLIDDVRVETRPVFIGNPIKSLRVRGAQLTERGLYRLLQALRGLPVWVTVGQSDDLYWVVVHSDGRPATRTSDAVEAAITSWATSAVVGEVA